MEGFVAGLGYGVIELGNAGVKTVSLGYANFDDTATRYGDAAGIDKATQRITRLASDVAANAVAAVAAPTVVGGLGETRIGAAVGRALSIPVGRTALGVVGAGLTAENGVTRGQEHQQWHQPPYNDNPDGDVYTDIYSEENPPPPTPVDPRPTSKTPTPAKTLVLTADQLKEAVNIANSYLKVVSKIKSLQASKKYLQQKVSRQEMPGTPLSWEKQQAKKELEGVELQLHALAIDQANFGSRLAPYKNAEIPGFQDILGEGHIIGTEGGVGLAALFRRAQHEMYPGQATGLDGDFLPALIAGTIMSGGATGFVAAGFAAPETIAESGLSATADGAAELVENAASEAGRTAILDQIAAANLEIIEFQGHLATYENAYAAAIESGDVAGAARLVPWIEGATNRISTLQNYIAKLSGLLGQ